MAQSEERRKKEDNKNNKIKYDNEEKQVSIF